MNWFKKLFKTYPDDWIITDVFSKRKYVDLHKNKWFDLFGKWEWRTFRIYVMFSPSRMKIKLHPEYSPKDTDKVYHRAWACVEVRRAEILSLLEQSKKGTLITKIW